MSLFRVLVCILLKKKDGSLIKAKIGSTLGCDQHEGVDVDCVAKIEACSGFSLYYY